MSKKRRYFQIIYFAIMVVLFCCTAAFADYGWMTPINQIKKSITGPVALCVAAVALVGCGSSLVFGDGNLNGFVRQCLFIILVLSAVMCAESIMSDFKNGDGKFKGMTQYDALGSSNNSSK